jgi:hypothetical protein
MKELKPNYSKMKTFQQLCDSNVAFLNGEYGETFYHNGSVDDETIPLLDDLKRINKLGFISMDGQPAKLADEESEELQRSYLSGIFKNYKTTEEFVQYINDHNVRDPENFIFFVLYSFDKGEQKEKYTTNINHKTLINVDDRKIFDKYDRINLTKWVDTDDSRFDYAIKFTNSKNVVEVLNSNASLDESEVEYMLDEIKHIMKSEKVLSIINIIGKDYGHKFSLEKFVEGFLIYKKCIEKTAKDFNISDDTCKEIIDSYRR